MMEGPKTTTITFEHTQRGKPKLIDADGHSYYKHQASKDKKTEYYMCTNPECTGRLIYYKSIGEAKVTQPHLEGEQVDPLERARDAALEKIRTLTLDAKEGVKPIQLIRSILKELPPQVRVIMPPVESMLRRVRRWAKSFNIPLIKATSEDYRKEEGEESLEDLSAILATQAIKKGNRPYRRHQNVIPTLKRVDEHGNEIGAATLDEFLSGTTEWRKENDNNATNQIDEEDADEQEWAAAALPGSSSFPEDEDVGFVDEGGDDFQTDFEADPEPEVIPKKEAVISKSKSCVITTSSNPSRKMFQSKPVEHAVKSGERCFVCGDELIVSETLASSEETFRRACCYLNVKSEGTWFPRTENSKFYSFCESCTNEIMRIHSLYRKVEDIQSQIFRKVESVEKRIADAEIVDNWMAEAPHSTAVRFEGFRKQVLINYRNKLKLRREIRFGRKTGKGQSLIEIQPCTSAHMFAKDPKPISDDLNEGMTDETNPEYSEIASELQVSRRRTRGMPKSKKRLEEQVEAKPNVVSSYIEANPVTHGFEETSLTQEFDDDGFQNDFDDSQDAASVSSEKEMKFWQSDPSKLEVGRRNRDSKQGTTSNNDKDDEEQSPSDIDRSDDEEWGQPKRKRKSKRTPGFRQVPTKSSQMQPSNQSKKKTKNEAPKAKGVRTARCHNIAFPDCVLTKDGRVFMDGVEIIKNAPGAYKPRPFSISYTCGACGKIILGFWHIRQHICGHHLGLYKCHLCHKEFTSPLVVDRHITMAHEAPTYQDCPICGKTLRNHRTDNSIRRHRWTHLSEEEKKDPKYRSWCPRPSELNLPEEKKIPRAQTFVCDQCGKSFVMVAALRRHEQTHTNPTLLMCQYCGRTYTRRKRLRDHTVRCAMKGQPKNNLINFPCPKCPTRFTTKVARSKHIRRFHSTVVNAELPFPCSKCPRAFSTLSGLRHHKRVCIEGLKGYNNKRTSEPTPSTSSASRAGNSEFKTDLTETLSSTGYSQNTLQNDSSTAAAALGFNYSFLGGGNHYAQNQ